MTPDEINALPDRVRNYIYALETNADPAGTIQENGLLKDQTRELDAMIGSLKDEVERLQEVCVDRLGLALRLLTEIRRLNARVKCRRT